MSDTITVTSQIPVDLADLLTRVSLAEERSKSYYVKKGLELILRQRLEDLEDYEAAVLAHREFDSSGESPLTMDDVFVRE